VFLLNSTATLARTVARRRLADFERVAAEIVAVQLDQIEGVQEHAGVVSAVTDALEARHSIVVTGDRLAVDDAGPPAQPSQGLDDQREAVRQFCRAGYRAAPWRRPSGRGVFTEFQADQVPIFAHSAEDFANRGVRKV
jgi:hypothetical protein